jgi:hypothetical protein
MDTHYASSLQLQVFFLLRLRRFVVLARAPEDASPPALRKLANHATLSAYRDCLALGLEAEARQVLAQAAVTTGSRGDRT